jgi:hypothetical protein
MSWALLMLQALSLTGRFDLNKRLIPGSDKHRLGKVLQRVQHFMNGSHETACFPLFTLSPDVVEQCAKAVSSIADGYGILLPVTST